MTDTLKKIAEDTLLLAANIRSGEDLEEHDDDDPKAAAAMREWRIIELVVDIGERLARTAGFETADLWVPDAVQDIVEV